MAALGTNIKADGSSPVDDLAKLGVACVRIVATPEVNLSNYFAALADNDIRVWLVFARESFAGFGPMREDGQPTFETLAAGMAEYADRYAGQIARFEVGNEPDHVSDSSWTMPQAYFERLLFTARD